MDDKRILTLMARYLDEEQFTAVEKTLNEISERRERETAEKTSETILRKAITFVSSKIGVPRTKTLTRKILKELEG